MTSHDTPELDLLRVYQRLKAPGGQSKAVAADAADGPPESCKLNLDPIFCQVAEGHNDESQLSTSTPTSVGHPVAPA